MLVYGTESNATSNPFRISAPLAVYDYRAFGEMIKLTPPPTDKVTENFTGKEHDDKIALDYFGARHFDPFFGLSGGYLSYTLYQNGSKTFEASISGSYQFYFLNLGGSFGFGLQGPGRRAGGRFQVYRAVLQPETAP